MRLKPFVLLFAGLVLFLAASAAAVEKNRVSPLVESYAGGWIDWQEGAIYGIGRGMLDLHGGSHPKARRAAKVIALQSILKIAAGIHVDHRKTLHDLTEGSRVIELEALIQFTEHRRLWVENVSRPYYETVLRAPMTGIGGLTARLIQALNNRPMDRRLPSEPLPDEDQPWLVLDARQAGRSLPIAPALFPRIVSQGGRTLYDVGRVDTAALIARGMARYVTAGGAGDRAGSHGDREERRGDPLLRAVSTNPGTSGRQPLPGQTIVKKVVSIQGAAGTDLVVSEDDARSIEAEEAFSRVLKRCRVIIVVPHAGGDIGGRGNTSAPDFGRQMVPSGLPIPAPEGVPPIGTAYRG